METTSRRTVMKKLLALPLLGGVANWKLIASSFPLGAAYDETHATSENRFLAIRMLRLINTAELRYFMAQGHYADPTELHELDEVNQFLDSEKAQIKGIGRSLYSALHFDREEIVPGWQFKFKFQGKERRSYVVTLNDVSQRQVGALSTDDKGVIYEGVSLAPTESGSARFDASSVLVAGRALGSSKDPSRKVASFFRTVALGAGTTIPTECCGGCCNCSCCCPPGSGGQNGCNTNCGCGSCTWCLC